MNEARYDWCTLPLHGRGHGLVEASAGTGKTWTIAALYLRLLLEQHLLPPQVVVTSFSKAAAQELRERLRQRLFAALALAEAPAPPGAAGASTDADAVEAWLRQRWCGDAGRQRCADEAIHLRLALSEFDRAPITTLHALCGRILADHALAAGADFGTTTMTSGASLDAQLRDDQWRRIVQAPAAQRSLGERAWANAGYHRFSTALVRVCEPGIAVRPIAFAADAIPAVMQASRAQAIRTWLAQHGATRLKANSTWHRNLGKLADFIERGDPVGEDRPEFAVFAEPLTKPFLKAHAEAAEHDPLVAFVRHAAAVLEPVLAAAQAATLAACRAELLAERDRRLRQRGELSFDATIARVDVALHGPDGPALAAGLRSAWPIALVDEFQDTDARQFAVLARIWPPAACHATLPDDGDATARLLLIGDPKQAIYAFRGGDVAAYLAAREGARERLRLDINHRSTPALVAACNEWFAEPCAALGRDGDHAIRYLPARARDGSGDTAMLTIDGVTCSRPLAIHVRSDASPKLAAAALRALALEACANHVARLLQEGRHRIGARPLAPGDLAVLLPKNQDLIDLRAHLSARGVACVGAGTQSVFATDVARDLRLLLHALSHVHDPAAVRAALATPLFFARDFDRLRAHGADPSAWQRTLQDFAGWQRRWHEHGVQAMLASVIAAQAAGLGGQVDSERRLTDLRHLGELLQAQERHGDGPQALQAWLARQCAGDGHGDDDADAGDERRLRIESDTHRVRLLTLHASKGLQFNVVFLPLLWAHTGRRIAWPLAREVGDGPRLLDLGGPDRDAALAAQRSEDLDERFRVLYVALTRARHACHVMALAQAATGVQGSALQEQIERLRRRAGTTPLAEACPHIDWSSGWDWAPTRLEPAPAAPPAVRMARTPTMPLRPRRGRYSFTHLASRHPDGADVGAAGDEPLPTVESEGVADTLAHPALAALASWRGRAFGNALHAILQQRALAMPLPHQQDLIATCLREAGIDAGDLHTLTGRVATRLQAVLDADLRPADAGPLRLAELPAARQCSEMAFRHTLDGVRMERLRQACGDHGEPDLVPTATPPVLRGMLHGSIDLVFEHQGRFHVLDWKSNFLGPQLDDYAPASLVRAMDQHHYRFQALLYTLALERYLRARLPAYDRASHLGAAIYLFVRAVGVAPAAGVWTQRFPDALIAAADAVMAQGEAEETT